jgi:tetratricopeptide (TPR) repeat protein
MYANSTGRQTIVKSFSCLVPSIKYELIVIAALYFVLINSAGASNELGAQLCPRGCSLHGKIENIPRGTSLVVELSPLGDGRMDAHADIDIAGEFSFDSVPAGDYQLRVDASGGQILYEQFVTVSSDNESIVIHLAERQVERPTSGTISARSLERKVPGKAFKELKRSEEASSKGDVQKAVDHLVNAIRFYPGYLEAHNNLGVNYLRLNRLEESLAEFQQAKLLDPDDALVNVNLGSTLLIVGRYTEAEAAARRAMKSDHGSDRARYVLALSLKAQNRASQEALNEFRRVVRQFPRARLASAEILLQQGHRDEAADELKQYLGGPITASDRKLAESWVAKLQQ